MTLLQLAVNVASLAIGVGLGYWLARRQNKKLDKIDPTHAPHHKPSKANVRNVIGILLFIMAIFIVISTSQTNDRAKEIADQRANDAQIQGECNDEFFRVLSERTKITADDNALNRSDADALKVLVQQLLATPPEAQTAESTFAALRDYQEVTDANEAKRDQNAQERQANPYPEPRCGN